MQLTKGSSYHTTMPAINLHRWPIPNTTGINTKTQELILKYYKLPGHLLKLHINYSVNSMSKTGLSAFCIKYMYQ